MQTNWDCQNTAKVGLVDFNLFGIGVFAQVAHAEEAIDYIKEQAGILFDPLIVEALTRLPYKEFTQGEKIIA